MSDLVILGAPQSNYVWTTRIVAAEKGVPHVLQPARPHTPEISAIHPFGRIPAMRHNDVTLCESRAIAHYIDRTFEGPSLVPTGTLAAACMEQWISLINTGFQPVLAARYMRHYFFPATPDGQADRTLIEAALPDVEACLKRLEAAVATGHLVPTDQGGGFTLAEAYLVPMLYYMSALPETGEIIRASRPLSAYLKTHLARPSLQETLPPPIPGPAEQMTAAAAAAARALASSAQPA